MSSKEKKKKNKKTRVFPLPARGGVKAELSVVLNSFSKKILDLRLAKLPELLHESQQKNIALRKFCLSSCWKLVKKQISSTLMAFHQQNYVPVNIIEK